MYKCNYKANVKKSAKTRLWNTNTIFLMSISTLLAFQYVEAYKLIFKHREQRDHFQTTSSKQLTIKYCFSSFMALSASVSSWKLISFMSGYGPTQQTFTICISNTFVCGVCMYKHNISRFPRRYSFRHLENGHIGYIGFPNLGAL